MAQPTSSETDNWELKWVGLTLSIRYLMLRLRRRGTLPSTVTQAFIASCLIKHTGGMTFEKRFRVMTIAMNYAEMAVN